MANNEQYFPPDGKYPGRVSNAEVRTFENDGKKVRKVELTVAWFPPVKFQREWDGNSIDSVCNQSRLFLALDFASEKQGEFVRKELGYLGVTVAEVERDVKCLIGKEVRCTVKTTTYDGKDRRQVFVDDPDQTPPSQTVSGQDDKTEGTSGFDALKEAFGAEEQ